ncbi:MAG: hypothetical protein KAU36_07395 [candidate division Zixibacteria bacterium]|nr:hypothetical protein [candidate division Zixibacteria bacterium]
MIWPDNKTFAFTVFDDTDFATLSSVRPVYEMLEDLGFRTTKSVWPVDGLGEPVNGGTTCNNREYLQWVRQLSKRGFEIGYHMATFSSSYRQKTIEALERFAELFGEYPQTMANHSACLENIYWGDKRLTGSRRLIYNLVTRFRFRNRYRGHVEGDPYFWGDHCRNKVKYVRNFVFPDINTLKACPIMPYHNPQKPFVNYWFASSEGPNVNSFNATLSEANQDRLEAEGGACIMYTHFGAGFVSDGTVSDRFATLMKRLSQKNGWFVPSNVLLDYLLSRREHHDITNRERRRLEGSWLRHKLRVGTT